jgi:hypothetical protein
MEGDGGDGGGAERREARGERREARGERREARGERREAREREREGKGEGKVRREYPCAALNEVVPDVVPIRERIQNVLPVRPRNHKRPSIFLLPLKQDPK